MKFIDSCVGNIARKIEDEFKESDHPRDKGGKFTSKGGEGRGGGKQEKSSSREASSSSSGGLSKGQRELASHVFNAIMTEAVGQNDFDSAKEARDYVRGYIEMMLDDSEDLAEDYGISKKEAVAAIKHANKSWKSSAQYKDPWESSYEDPYEESEGSEEDDDDEGYMGVSKEELAEEEEYENARERARREKDDDRVTGPEDRDYMNEEDDDDTTNSAAKDVKSMRQHLDEELFELATTSESEEEFKSKVKRKFDQYRWLLKNGHQDELPVGGKRAEYALKKIQSEIDSGTSEYW